MTKNKSKKSIPPQDKSIFSKIIDREIPAYIVYEDDEVIAFLDINPRSKGHLLVVPKEQVDHFDDLDDQLYQRVMQVSKQLTKRIKEVYQPKRVGMMIYGLDVPHAHVHLIPLYDGDEMKFSKTETVNDPEKLKEIAKKLS